MKLDEDIVSVVGGGRTWIPDETSVIDGDRMYFDEVSSYTEEDYQEDLQTMENITTRSGVTYSYFDSVEEAVGYVSEEKPRQKPSTLLLNLMRNI